MVLASNYALRRCHRQGVPLAPFYTTSLQPRANAFSSVTQSGNVEYEEEGGLHKHRYVNQRPVCVRGGEYTHLNQDKLVYFIYRLFIIERIKLVNNSPTSPFLPVT